MATFKTLSVQTLFSGETLLSSAPFMACERPAVLKSNFIRSIEIGTAVARRLKLALYNRERA